MGHLYPGRDRQRRLDARRIPVASVAAHPGIAMTEIVSNGHGAASWKGRLINAIQPLFAQTASQGALPLLYAAISAEATPGGYYGPTGLFEVRGSPGPAQASPDALNEDLGGDLWSVSEQLTKSGGW